MRYPITLNALVAVSGLSSAVLATSPIATVTPCSDCPKSCAPAPVTVTEQYQVVPTCSAVTSYSKKTAWEEAECSSYSFVSTTIPCNGGSSSTVVTKTDQVVTLSHESEVWSRFVPCATTTPAAYATAAAYKNETACTSTIYHTMITDIVAPYNECGPLAVPSWGGSGICEVCGDNPEDEKDQPVTVVKCVNDVCESHAETWVSTKPTPVKTSSAYPFSSSAYCSVSGVNTITVTATVSPSDAASPVTKTYTLTTSVAKPQNVDITKTFTVTYTVPTYSHYESVAPVSTQTFCPSNGVYTVPIVTTCKPENPTYTDDVTTTVYYTTTVTDGPKTIDCVKTVTITFTSTTTFCPETYISGKPAYPSSAPPSVTASTTKDAYPTSKPADETTNGAYPTSKPADETTNGGYPTSKPADETTKGGYPTAPESSADGGYPTSSPDSEPTTTPGYPVSSPTSSYPIFTPPYGNSTRSFSSSTVYSASSEPAETTGYPTSSEPAETTGYPTSSEPASTTGSGYPSSSVEPTTGYPVSSEPASTTGYPTSSEPASTTATGYPSSSVPATTSGSAAPTTPATVGDWDFYGCLGSTGGFPTFSLLESSASNDVELCTSECQASGFKYAGLHTTDCYCAKSIDASTDADKASGVCDIPCPGNSLETCGGDSESAPTRKIRKRISNTILLDVYECNTPTPTPTTTATGTGSPTGQPTSDPSSDPSSDPDPASVRRSINADMEVAAPRARDLRVRRGGVLRNPKLDAQPAVAKRDFAIKAPFGQ